MWGFFLWMKEDYGNELFDLQLGEQLRRSEILVNNMRRAVGYYEPLKAKEIQSVQGVYKMYMPSFFRTKQNILVSELVIGLTVRDEFRNFDCQLTQVFNDLNGVERTNVFVGKIIPHGNKSLIVLKKPDAGTTNILLHIDNIDPGEDNEAVHLGGIAIASVGDARASAWPIYAIRMSDEEAEQFEPSVIDAGHYHSLPDGVQDALARGAVEWNPRQYPKPYGEPSPQ